MVWRIGMNIENIGPQSIQSKDNSLMSLLQGKDRRSSALIDCSAQDSRIRSLEIIDFVGQLKDGIANQNIEAAINSLKKIDSPNRSNSEIFELMLSINAMKKREGVAPHLDILGLSKSSHYLIVIDQRSKSIGLMNVAGDFKAISQLPSRTAFI